MLKSLRMSAITILAVFILLGCAHQSYYKNGTAAYNSGDYDTAAYMAIEALKSKPDYSEAQGLLRNAAPLAYQYHLRKAEDYERLKNFDAAVSEFRAIERLSSAIASVRKDIILEDVSDKMSLAARNAAEAHYKNGLALLKGGEINHDSEKMKAAAIEFRKAQEFVAGYKDSRPLYEKARKEGAVRIAILPFSNPGSTNYGSMITEQVIAKALKQEPEFLEFVTRDHLYDIEKEKIIGLAGVLEPKTAVKMGTAWGVNYIVTGKIHSVSVDIPKRADARGSNSCKIREKKDQYRNGSASWITHEQKASALANSSFQLIDVKTGQILSADTVKTEEADIARWIEFTGDEDCLPWEVRNFPNGKKTVESGPVILDMAIEKESEEIANKLTEKFR